MKESELKKVAYEKKKNSLQTFSQTLFKTQNWLASELPKQITSSVHRKLGGSCLTATSVARQPKMQKENEWKGHFTEKNM